MSQVHNEWRDVALPARSLDHVKQLSRLQAQFSNIHQKAPLLPNPVEHQAKYHQRKDRYREMAQDGKETLTPESEITEKAPREQIGQRPHRRSGHIVKCKACIRHAGLSCDRSRDG